MTIDDLQKEWHSPYNQLSEKQQQTLVAQFTRRMMQRRRFQCLWLINTFFWLTVITVLAIRTIVIGKVELTREWVLLPLLIVPWGFAVHFLRRYLKPTAPLSRGDFSVTDTLRAALVSNRENQSHLKRVSILFALVIPMLALAMHQLYRVGKVSERELLSMAVFFGAILLLCGAGIAVRYFGRLRPQQQYLNTLLVQLTDEPK